MKIKTIKQRLDHAEEFDRKVNEALAEGWRLTRRDVLMPPTEPVLYAELVKLDPPATPESDPMEALRSIQAFCLSVDVKDCCTERCPLSHWCQQLKAGGDPTDWELPDEEVGA